MALANKDHMPNDSTMANIIQASAFYEHNYGASNSSVPDHMYVYREPGSPEKPSGLAKNFAMSNSPSASSPSSTNSNGLGYQATPYNNLSEEGNSVISFKPDYGSFVHGGGSLLSFEQTKRVRRNLYPRLIGEEEEYPIWEDDLHNPNGYHSQLNPKSTTGHGLPETSSAATGYGSPSGGGQLAWLNDQEEDTITNAIQEMGRQESSNTNKRPSTVNIQI